MPDMPEFLCVIWGTQTDKKSSLSLIFCIGYAFFVVLIRKEVGIAKSDLQEAEFQQDTSHLGIHVAGQDARNIDFNPEPSYLQGD